jgi:XTP/dITP diphosphohydrolase
LTTLLIATTNPGKLREIAEILSGVPHDLQTLGDLPPVVEPSETGVTFAENARIKAMYYAAATGELTVAEDSGLVIDALDGAPGVHSARWYGTEYDVKFRKIQQLLRDRGLATSPARFVCHLTLARGRQVLYETEQTVEGRIAEEPTGDQGFGYDPIFFYPPLGVTLAQVDHQQKSRISHRGKAFSALREYLLGQGIHHRGTEGTERMGR